MSAFAKKYLDPKWQKRRLEILEDYGWTCQECFDNESTLHVHHRYYRWDTDPWDYPDTAFVVLCDECHAKESGRSEAQRSLSETIAEYLLTHGMMNMAVVIEALFDGTRWCPETAISTIGWLLETGRWHDLEDEFIGLKRKK